MSKLNINGKDIRELAEFNDKSNITRDNIFSYGYERGKINGVLTSANEHACSYPEGFIYAGPDVLKGLIKRNGNPIKIAAKGCRPDFSNLLAEVGAGTYYLHYLADGAVWLSTSSTSASGIQLSTAAQVRKTFLFVLYGAGGGGGAGNNSVFLNYFGSAGGGGGGLTAVCVYLKRGGNTYNKFNFKVGSGGSGGSGSKGRGKDGSSTEMFASDGRLIASAKFGGGGGYNHSSSNNNGGEPGIGGGSDAVDLDITDDFASKVLIKATGSNGAYIKNTTSSTSAQTGTTYIPEGGTFTYSPGYSQSGSDGGGGWNSGVGGCGYAGKGGRSVANDKHGNAGETSGGGSGAGGTAGSTRSGGRGGNGLLRIYY